MTSGRVAGLALATLCMWACTRSAGTGPPRAPAEGQAPSAVVAAEADAAPAKDAAAQAADAARPEVRGCRRPLPPLPPAASSSLELPAGLIADAIGNRDGVLTGVEVEVSTALAALPASARCWLGVDWDPAKGMSGAPLDLVLDAVCGLDCGDTHRGLESGDGPIFPGDCPAAIPITAAGESLVPGQVMVFVDRASPFTLAGDAPEVRSTAQPMRELAETLAEAEPACASEVRASGAKWSEALGAGRCLADRLGRWGALGDAHHDPPPCGWSLAMLDLAGVRQCAAGDEALAQGLFAVFASWAFPTTAGPVDLPMGELVGDQRLPGRSDDSTRVIEWGRRLEAQRALDARGRAELLNALTTVPLGLVDGEVGRLLQEALDVRRLDDTLLVWLAQRERLAETPRGFRSPSTKGKGAIGRRVNEQCAVRLIGSVVVGGAGPK